MKRRILYLLMLLAFITIGNSFCMENNVFIKNDSKNKIVVFGNSGLRITLDYMNKCVVTKMEINNNTVVSNGEGVYSKIKAEGNTYSSLVLQSSPLYSAGRNEVIISGIKYAASSAIVNETWKFNITSGEITFNITREISKDITAEEAAFPSFNFDNINTWEGAFQGNGGVAWFYLFNEKLCTYGVHTNNAYFWNSRTDAGLHIAAGSPGANIAMKYSRRNDDKLEYNITSSKDEIGLRYDEDTYRRRFIRGKTDVWSDIKIKAGKYSEAVTLSPFSYKKEYNRGSFKGIDGSQVTSVLNTIARIGVIDSKLYGGNSWHTPYGPICLHEQYIAQFGIAINDTNYINGYRECLDYYRDNAINPDGRVLPRWAYDNSDAMPGTATAKGFYEAQWGYLLDSNPDYVANVGQMFNMSGDLKWVMGQKESCEKALEYMLKRDTNKNNLVEMMTDSYKEARGSDWIDIIWASFENAFVNAKLYYALTLWADVEKQLGDKTKADYYLDYADKLKYSFNRPIEDGGFWDTVNGCYVHWLDKDGSVHGNNFVVPVNLMAIAYGICDDAKRSSLILDKLENQMQKENLFIWPLCLYSYNSGEGKEWQFPFPVYENGDIFLSWGAVGVQAYANYKPDIALKYIENVLARHKEDGLAFQRYGRQKQDGKGDDILAGNFLAIAGLYQSIYGINPLYNRLYLNPHLPEKLNGTELIYEFRGDKLNIALTAGKYSISNKKYKLTAAENFGFSTDKDGLSYYLKNDDKACLKAIVKGKDKLSLEIIKWEPGLYSWYNSSTVNNSKVKYTIQGVSNNSEYTLFVDGKELKQIKSSNNGTAEFEITAGKQNQLVEIKQ